MNKLRSRSFISMLMIFFQLSMAVLSTSPRLALAQTRDIDPPVIEFDSIPTGNRGDKQVFAATVIDDVAVQSVTLYYRFEEETAFLGKTMKMLGASGIFTVTLDSQEVPESARFIQYYLEASDSVGNRSFQGFAFDPLERQIVSVSQVNTNTPSEPIASGGMSLNQKLLIGAVGILVLGALASSGGGGSSTPAVPVTVVVDELP